MSAKTSKARITEPLFHKVGGKHDAREKGGLTIAVDGKTIRSTGKMCGHESPLHIVSAQISELGMTFVQKCTDSKSNEIPAMQNFLEELDVSGCIVVADALNCQKKTATTIVAGKGDYPLCVKDNHETPKNDIEEYVQGMKH